MRVPLLVCLLCCFSLPLSAKTLIVGLTQMGNPPLTFAKQDKRRGIYRAVLAEIGKLSGDKFVFRYFPPKRLLSAFEKGQIHIEPGINPSWRINAKVPGNYTEPFTTSENIVLFAPGKKRNVMRPMDFLNQRIGTIRGYYYPGYMTLFESGRIIREEGDSEYNLLARMAGGRFDQIFVQKDVALYWMNEIPEFSNFEIGPVNFKDPIMLRVHPTVKQAIPRLNQSIVTLRENGTIEKIYQEYR